MSVPGQGTAPGAASGDRVALVTGASRGIGAHFVRALREAGWTVVGLSRSGGTDPDGAPLLGCDVTDAAAVGAVVDGVVADHGRIDLLINNAGLVEPELPLWEADPETWWQTVVTNVRGPFLTCRAVLPVMIAQGGGRVINLNSGAGTRERADLTAYCASKSALARITGGIALDGAEHGIYALDLAPGVVETDMTHSMRMHEGRTDWTDPGDVTAIALAFADGELDGFSGRMVRAGADSLDTLRERSAAGLGPDDRALRLRPWGPDDPLAG
ncbi:SDR family NAD(P)-dependent oxidoreductase [Ornithinicoccus hortensis]|uniref:NADP-dependent 3-hydroxy acid dehydrogenase YdfG n=1 Tax=Ornithinicoccus hortensis TaxID=82346 RepID=A0A542YSA8_9MICO|nr:SDR family oxidoreductase [Ornithinicoccus hortensis]TQL50985.1 NADP-dependent 3-hydroxy acid dehydrogenase YdfG [Ornithinicoccus hortensis]